MTAPCHPTLHHPVLLQETMEWLRPQPGGVYLDGTLGLGGHSRAILERSAPDGVVLAFDWDDEAMALARKELAPFGARIHFMPFPFSEMAARCALENISRVDGILLDLGVSSLHLNSAARGFSFQQDGPLDMRMDRRRGKTAADIIQQATEEELADIFYYYGEERFARRIARRIVYEREHAPITGTLALAEVVTKAMPRAKHKSRKKKTHPATKTFQGLRIAVNDELTILTCGLQQAAQLLRPGGRLCVISFHSLEDRIVKQTLVKDEAWNILTSKPIAPTDEECRCNRRARSARLRVAARA